MASTRNYHKEPKQNKDTARSAIKERTEEPSQRRDSTSEYALHVSTREERPMTQDVWIIDSAYTSHMSSHGEWIEHKRRREEAFKWRKKGDTSNLPHQDQSKLLYKMQRAYRVFDITARVILETADIYFRENNNVISEEKQSDNNTATDTYFFIQKDEQLDNHVLSDVDSEEPAPDTMINRQTESSGSDRPQRTRTIPKRFDDYVLATSNKTIPKDYDEAIAREDKKHWENAMLEEIQNMYSHQVWELVPRPVNAKVVKSKWVFKISKDQENKNKTYKARPVAMGYNQTPGRDYNEGFSPVIKIATLRTILSLAATKDSVIKLFDVKAAYLNGNIENTIFMEQPAGFVQDRNKVCKLNKEIKSKAEDCEFENIKDSLIRDRIVLGCRDTTLREKYLQNPDLTLSLAINQGQAAEASQKQLRNIEKDSIDAIRKNSNERYKPTTSLKNSYTSKPVRANFNKSIRCSKCNMAHDFGKCPAYGKECYKCRQPNHFANCCKNRAIRCIQEIEGEKDNLLIIDSIMVGQVLRKPWKELIYIQGHPVDIKLDTGADVNILPESLIKEWPNMPMLETADCKIYTYTGQQIPVVGKCLLDCKTKYACRKVTFLIVNNSAVPILGLDECVKLNLVKRVETISDISVTLTGLLDEYKDVFKGNGHLSYMYDIKISDEAEPKICPARRLPRALLQPVKEELFKMEEDGIIEKIEEPTVWAHPMVVFISGKSMIPADTLSRHFLPQEQMEDKELDLCSQTFVLNVEIKDQRLTRLQEDTLNDKECCLLKQYILTGWPLHKKNLPSNLKPYWEFKEELLEWQNLICRGNKLLIPKTQRSDTLKILHASHQGINNTIALAKGFIYWPGMNKEIEELINNCSIRQQTSRANLKEPLLPHQAPEYPLQKVGIDIFQIESSKYLLIVDYFSKYPEIYQLQDMTTDTIIRRLKRTFSNFGIPETLVSDNGPPFFSKEFQNFTRTWNIVHVTSSPYHAQSNGMVERTVQTLKKLIKRCGEESTDPYLALLNLRNTPHNNLPSPAQILMSRKLRSIIPSKTSQFVPSMINNEAIQNQLVDNQVKMKNYYDRHTRPADPLSINDRVWFRKDKKWIPGQLKNQANEPRSFYVKDQEGNENRRNRIHIREDKRSETTHTDWEKPLELNQEQADLQDLEETPSQPTSSGQLSSPGSPENVTTTGPPESCTNGSPGNLITTRSGRIDVDDGMAQGRVLSHSLRVRVWRRCGERSNPAAIVERPTVRQRGIMVWGAIAYDSRSPLPRIQGTMTAQRYVDDVLRPVTLPYLQGVPNALYQQDNDRPHTARISQQALQDVQMLPWPQYSPDPSPIEHVWDIIGRRLHALPQPCSEDELWQMVEREWRAIPQDAIRTLIDSLHRRVAACIAVRGNIYHKEKWQAIRNMEAGQSQTEVARWLWNNKKRCLKALEKFQTTANVARTPGQRRTRVKTLNQDRLQPFATKMPKRKSDTDTHFSDRNDNMEFKLMKEQINLLTQIIQQQTISNKNHISKFSGLNQDINIFFRNIEDAKNDERDRKKLVILNLEEEAKNIFYRLGLRQETYLNIKQKLSTIYISKKKTTLEELFTHQLEKPEKINDYYHFKVVGALENSLPNKQIVEALTAGVTYDLKKMIYTRNPQTPEEWLDYVNTIQKRPVTRGQPTPQRGLDRWQPESTPPPSQ
ncbi:K02A2.6-like, partial [Cordylochernes scorpioides]